MYTLSEDDRELLLAQGMEPDEWEEEFDRFGGHDRRTYEPHYDRYEEPPSQTMLWTVLGTAVGVQLAMFPCFRRQRRGDELLRLGAAIGALIGLCRDRREFDRQ